MRFKLGWGTGEVAGTPSGSQHNSRVDGQQSPGQQQLHQPAGSNSGFANFHHNVPSAFSVPASQGALGAVQPGYQPPPYTSQQEKLYSF